MFSYVAVWVNVGAGTLFANFDGRNIQHSQVGSDTYIGNGSILVAPLAVEPNAQIAHGSVVVSADSDGREAST